MSGIGRYDETDFGGEDVAVVKLRSGHAVALPRSARRLSEDQGEVLRDLQLLGSQLAQLEDRADELARDCRAMGVPWSLIGWCLGITAEAARRRYRPEDDDD